MQRQVGIHSYTVLIMSEERKLALVTLFHRKRVLENEWKAGSHDIFDKSHKRRLRDLP